jgi:16S rRNA A1518/A1519 N6-dimethyltransferase RsmA/KsgA/DIM1 with predicted DNA glycosylase/AP lyase activity
MIDIENNTIDLDIFKNVLREIKNSNRLDIIDSFSDNQFKSKLQLIDMIEECKILQSNLQVSIFGSWYGSLLVPLLAHKVKKIIMIDLDDEVIKIAKNRLFPKYKNIDYITADVFEKDREKYWSTKLFINTSCEHMKPMNEWPYWNHIKCESFFAFQSNNMYQIDTHVNCVSSLQEFKKQMPGNSQILAEHELKEERGIRFTLLGKIN